MAVYDVNGLKIDGMENVNFDITVRSVNHRGYSVEAPENTLPAYKLSKENGFFYVETDVSFTQDNVAVCLHDATIDRTSNGSGRINDMTFEQVRAYDFGSWKSGKYAGTKIPSLEEFLLFCKRIILHPYIEIKNTENYTEAQIQQIIDMVRLCGMRGKVTYISFNSAFLSYVKDYDAEARIGLIASTPSTADVSAIKALRTGDNDVFYDVGYFNGAVTNAICEAFSSENIPIEVWTVDVASDILALNRYISGVTSNSLIAGKVLYQYAMGQY